LGHWGFQAKENAGLVGTSVEAVTVDTLMTRYGLDFVDLLRVDIEGAEQEVFADVSRWIHKVGTIGVELHDRLKTGCSRSFYIATREFDWEYRLGETVFVGRGERPNFEPVTRTSHESSLALVRRRYCTILSAS